MREICGPNTLPAAFLTAAMVAVSGCAERDRPVFGPDDADVTGPVVQFEFPTTDTTVTRGARVDFRITVISELFLIRVETEVSGAVNFVFPPVDPISRTYTAEFSVPTSGARGDTVRVTVDAFDAGENDARGVRLILLRSEPSNP